MSADIAPDDGRDEFVLGVAFDGCCDGLVLDIAVEGCCAEALDEEEFVGWFALAKARPDSEHTAMAVAHRNKGFDPSPASTRSGAQRTGNPYVTPIPPVARTSGICGHAGVGPSG